jgi:hypothetical protein
MKMVRTIVKREDIPLAPVKPRDPNTFEYDDETFFKLDSNVSRIIGEAKALPLGLGIMIKPRLQFSSFIAGYAEKVGVEIFDDGYSFLYFCRVEKNENNN